MDRLRRNQSEWRAGGAQDYDFEFQQSCFCGGPYAVRIQVRGGNVAQVIDLATSEVIDPATPGYRWWPTIDSLFARYQRNHEFGYKLDITYDRAFHFPARAVGDLPRAIDDEFTHVLRNFARVQPGAP